MWRSHFEVGIVQTADDFGTQGLDPVQPGTARLAGGRVHPLGLGHEAHAQADRDVGDLSPEHPRSRPTGWRRTRATSSWPAAQLIACRPSSSATRLFTRACLVDKPGGDSVFPVQPDLIWDGVAQGFVVYPTNTPDDQNHRKSMYTFVKRNQGPANMLVFDMPDRTQLGGDPDHRPTRPCRRWC